MNLTPLDEKNSGYEPDQQQILEYAEYIGFELPADQQYLWLAVEGLKADLPYPWQACSTPDDDIVYRNRQTGELQQQHPLDEVYREKLRMEKLKTRNMLFIENIEKYGIMDLPGIKQENESERTKTEAAVAEKGNLNKQNLSNSNYNSKVLSEEVDEVVRKIMTSSEKFRKQGPTKNNMNVAQNNSGLGTYSQKEGGSGKFDDRVLFLQPHPNPTSHRPGTSLNNAFVKIDQDGYGSLRNVGGLISGAIITEQSQNEEPTPAPTSKAPLKLGPIEPHSYKPTQKQKQSDGRPDMDYIQQQNTILSAQYTKKLEAEVARLEAQSRASNSNSKIGQTLKAFQKEKRSRQTQLAQEQIKSLKNSLAEKAKMLQDLQKQRMKQERELVQMQAEFEAQKQLLLKEYRQKLKRKLQREKQTKERELRDKFESMKHDLKKTVLK